MATAHIRGPSLHQAVREHGSLDADRVRALAAGLAEGLAAIHACGRVHRYLKPGNIILADDGPRIIDFGIARSLDASTILPSTFSLGSVLAFAATGRSPFAANSMAAVVYRITRESPNLAQVPGGAVVSTRSATTTTL